MYVIVLLCYIAECTITRYCIISMFLKLWNVLAVLIFNCKLRVWATFLTWHGLTNPDLITKTSVHPAMSNHSIVISEIDITAKQAKKQSRVVLLHKKGNMDNIGENMKKLCEDQIETTEDDIPVEHLWRVFKNGLMASIKKHIHQKTISGRWDVPWMNKEIKRKIHQKLTV